MNNPLPGLPLIESPLFPALKTGLGLTQEEERIAISLSTDGYAVLEFPDPEINVRIERIKARLAGQFGINATAPETIEAAGGTRVQDAWTFDEDVREIAANESIIDLLTKLYGRPAFPFQTLNFPVGTQQAAHTDTVHFSCLPERFMCGVWLAMEDITPEAGPLFYFPGSHRWPIMSNALIGRRGYGDALGSAQEPYGPAWNALCEVHDARPKQFLARKGQALIWCANLLHGGSPQNDPRQTRWSQVTHYYFENCIYYTPAFSDESLGKLQIRRPISILDGLPKENKYLGDEFYAENSASNDARRKRRKHLINFFNWIRS